MSRRKVREELVAFRDSNLNRYSGAGALSAAGRTGYLGTILGTVLGMAPKMKPRGSR